MGTHQGRLSSRRGGRQRSRLAQGQVVRIRRTHLRLHAAAGSAQRACPPAHDHGRSRSAHGYARRAGPGASSARPGTTLPQARLSGPARPRTTTDARALPRATRGGRAWEPPQPGPAPRCRRLSSAGLLARARPRMLTLCPGRREAGGPGSLSNPTRYHAAAGSAQRACSPAHDHGRSRSAQGDARRVGMGACRCCALQRGWLSFLTQTRHLRLGWGQGSRPTRLVRGQGVPERR